MESKIKQYIMDLIGDPLINIYDHASEIFGENVLPSNPEINLVVPELAELPTTRRRLVQDIILLKTRYKIAIAKDGFMDGTVILIDKTGEAEKK